MTILHIYLLLSTVFVLAADNFFCILGEEYSWWLVPLLIFTVFIVLVIIQLLALGIMVITASMKKPPGRGERFFRFLVRYSLPILIGIAKVKINARDTDKLPKNQKMLFVCNHQHNFDPVIIINSFPDAKISFIGKKDIITEMPLAARAMQRLSCLFIDRENNREAAKTIVTAINYLKEDRCSIGLFPEGYCSKDDRLLPFRNGSLKIALKAKVPVAVCVINNMKKLSSNIFRKTTVVDFRLVDIIYPEVFENMTTSELGNLIHSKMSAAYDEMRGIKSPVCESGDSLPETEL